jgi:hypothetical protein
MMQHIRSKAHKDSHTEAISDKHKGQAQPRLSLEKNST